MGSTAAGSTAAGSTAEQTGEPPAGIVGHFFHQEPSYDNGNFRAEADGSIYWKTDICDIDIQEVARGRWESDGEVMTVYGEDGGDLYWLQEDAHRVELRTEDEGETVTARVFSSNVGGDPPVETWLRGGECTTCEENPTGAGDGFPCDTPFEIE